MTDTEHSTPAPTLDEMIDKVEHVADWYAHIAKDPLAPFGSATWFQKEERTYRAILDILRERQRQEARE